MIDSTGNGQADLLFVDTTGDGQPDRPCHHYGVDTTGDGRTDALLADTTGDGQADSLVLDTTGNGLPDTAVSGVMVDISGDGKPDMVLLDDQPNDCDDPAVRDRISTDLVSIYGAETNALSETNALHSKALSPEAARKSISPEGTPPRESAFALRSGGGKCIPSGIGKVIPSGGGKGIPSGARPPRGTAEGARAAAQVDGVPPAAAPPTASPPAAAVSAAAASANMSASAGDSADGSRAKAPRASTSGCGKQGWTQEEDEHVVAMVGSMGTKWSKVAAALEGRTDDAVRNRYLRLKRKAPGDDNGGALDLAATTATKKGDMWTAEEDETICDAVERLGQKWAPIAALLPGRSPNAVRNRFLRVLRPNQLAA